jgi:hypothetical protein
MKYVLYTHHNNRYIDNILTYLNYQNYNLDPYILHYSLENESPSIYSIDNNMWYIGEKECIRFYVESSLITHLKDKAEYFNRNYSMKNSHKIKVE